VEADWDVIRSKLDSDLQASFIASVYASRIENSVLEPLFDGLGGFAYLPADSPSAPALRVASHWIHRSAFVAPTWAPHENNPSGSTLEAALFDDLEAAAVDAPAVQARLGSTDDALAAIDEAMSSIEAAGSGLIVFFGNWLETNISMHVPSGEFTPNWQTTTPESASDGLLGHYRGSPVVDAFSAGPPRILVLDLPRWGCLLRAPMANGEEMQIDIEPVTAELARKRLDEDSGHFPNESDDEGKLRKLQTLVQSVINERVGFVVKDASFARWIRPETDEPATDTEDSPPASADEDDGD
jgi:hypothetical protein